MIGPFVVSSSPPPGGFVLDVSVPAAWLFTSRGTLYTSGVLGKILSLKACVPNSWPLDLAEAVRIGERQGLKTAAEVDLFLTRLIPYPIFVEIDTPARAWYEILALSRRLAIPINAAAYLELALRLNLPLATTDAVLTRAVTSVSAPHFTP